MSFLSRHLSDNFTPRLFKPTFNRSSASLLLKMILPLTQVEGANAQICLNLAELDFNAKLVGVSLVLAAFGCCLAFCRCPRSEENDNRSSRLTDMKEALRYVALERIRDEERRAFTI